MNKRKTALVTGGSRGIGRAICVKLASMGMNIAFIYNKDVEGAEETAKKCAGYGADVIPIRADITKSEECAKSVKEIAEKTENRIDVLVNNAGITRDKLIMRMTDQDFDAVLDANLKGAFYMMREVSSLMLKQRSGRIVNISSVVGVIGNPGQVNYAASKAGIIGMTKSLARELAPRKITVNAVAPGMIETKMTEAMNDNARAAALKNIPFGEMGSPEDIANAVAFFASDESGYITGQVLCVDGGMAI